MSQKLLNFDQKAPLFSGYSVVTFVCVRSSESCQLLFKPYQCIEMALYFKLPAFVVIFNTIHKTELQTSSLNHKHQQI